MHFFLSVLTIFAAVFSVVPDVFAAPQYSVSPLVIDESLERRDIVNREITITNTGSEPVTIYPSVNNISLKEGGTIEEFLAPVESDRSSSLAAWIEISRTGIDLAAGEQKVLPLTFRISADAAPLEYHALIGFGHGRNRDEAEAMVKNGRAPGVVVSVNLADTTFSLLKIAAFVVDRFVTRADNQAAVYTFKNPGDQTLTPEGEIIIYDQNGREVSTIPVNAEKIAVPPGGEHVFTAQMPVDGLLGKYKAFLSVEYGDTQRGSVQDTNFFYVLPLKLLLMLCGMLLVVAAVAAWHVHRKYFDGEDTDDSDRLMLRVRETESDPLHHDLHITRS